MMNVEDRHTVAVIGAGLMGHGIAQEFAVSGYDVHLYDITDDRLRQAMDGIRKRLQALADDDKITRECMDSSLANIYPSTDLQQVASPADVVIEAVLENLELKLEIFQKLDTWCPAHTILASNTSTLMPSKLASATQRPDKVLNTHYFNPPYSLPLVEIVRHDGTSEESVDVVFDLLTKIGKSPVVVQKEALGFIGNRLQHALFREALSLVEKGIATPEDIDIVVKTGFGRRYSAAGPFEIWELAGWDLILSSGQYLLPDLESSPDVSPILEKMVSAGELGVKTGKGFYDWTPETAEALKQKVRRMLELIDQADKND